MEVLSKYDVALITVPLCCVARNKIKKLTIPDSENYVVAVTSYDT